MIGHDAQETPEESVKAVLADVRKEMARPRVAESAQQKSNNPPALKFTHRRSSLKERSNYGIASSIGNTDAPAPVFLL
jgi:hypothetical protein